MPKLKHYSQFRNLASVQTLFEDTVTNSRFFRLTQIPDTLTAGKNVFLINGSPELEPSTTVLVEIVDSVGNTIFRQPIPRYQEGLARVVSVEVYQDTPPGTATMTILGEARLDANDNSIPAVWQGKYNVKYTHKFTVDPSRPNTTPIRFYQAPTVGVIEYLQLYRDTTYQTVVASGLAAITGSPQNSYLSGTLSNTYLLQTSFPLSSSFASITASLPTGVFSSSISRVLNRSTAFLTNGYIQAGAYASFAVSSSITASYQVPVYTPTTMTRSFAAISLGNLTTFGGDVERAHIYVRSVDSHGDYEKLADVAISPTDLTMTQSVVDQSFVDMGSIVGPSTLNTYWQAGLVVGPTGSFTYLPTGSVSLVYDGTTLIDSTHLSISASVVGTESHTPKYFFGLVPPLSFNQKAEYTFQHDLVGLSTSGIDARLEIYLSGSAFPTPNTLGQLITTYESPVGQTQITKIADSTNFIAPVSGTATLNYVVYGGDWYAANVSIQSAEDIGYNPDQASILLPITNKRFENLQFRVELADLNFNVVPLDLESAPTYFVGGNFYAKGLDNRMQGNFTLAASGSGPVLAVNSSGSFIGISPGTAPQPVDPSQIVGYTGPPIVSIFSGSTPFSASLSGSAMGFQIAAGNSVSSSFLSFDTLTGRLIIRGDITLLPGTALSQSVASAGSGSGTQALNEIQLLVSGNLFGGTFLNGTQIISPTIAGNVGYFSSIFGVGNVAAGTGITLTALGYTASNGIPQSGSPAIFIGQGTYGNANTPFLVASSSAGGILSLGAQLLATSSAGQFSLIVSGNTIAVQSGSGWVDVRTYALNITASLSASINNAVTQSINFSSSLAAQSVNFSSSQAAYTTNVSSSIVSTVISISQSQAALNVVDAAHRIQLPTNVTKSVAGLYLEAAAMGFWQPHPSGNGSSSANFPVLINNAGQFVFADSSSFTGSAPTTSSTGGYWSNYLAFANGAFVLATENLLLNTPGMQLAGFAPSASSFSFLKLGPNAASMSLTTGAGVYMDGTGNWRVGTATSSSVSSSFVQFTPSPSALIISSSTFFLNAQDLSNNLVALNNFLFRLGNPAPSSFTGSSGGAIGAYFNNAGQFFLGSGSANPNIALAGTGSWISFGGQGLSISAQALVVTTPTLALNSLVNSGTITLGSVAQNLTGSGFYADGFGNLQLGNPATSSTGAPQAFLQFLAAQGQLFASNIKANNFTLTNAVVQSSASSQLYASVVSASAGVMGSLIIDSSRFASANPFDSLVIYSGSSQTTSSTIFEMARFGTYTKIQSGSQQFAAFTASSTVTTTGLNGNASVTTINTSSVAIQVNPTASFLNNIVRLSATSQFIENNNVSTAYGIDYKLEATASWTGNFAPGTSTVSQSVYEHGASIAGATTINDVLTSYNVPVPSTRTSNVLFVRTRLIVTTAQFPF